MNMTTATFDHSLATLKALADATRLKLIGLIAERERSVGDLAQALKLKEPTISHHLAKLQENNLVSMRSEGTAHYYRLNPTALQRIGRTLAESAKAAAIKVEAGADDWETKVLKTYVRDGQLNKIPDIRKKRDVILKWLILKFEKGRHYKEIEVNEIIKKIHPDFATLRRELIMAKLMSRENNIYQRV